MVNFEGKVIVLCENGEPCMVLGPQTGEFSKSRDLIDCNENFGPNSSE